MGIARTSSIMTVLIKLNDGWGILFHRTDHWYYGWVNEQFENYQVGLFIDQIAKMDLHLEDPEKYCQALEEEFNKQCLKNLLR